MDYGGGTDDWMYASMADHMANLDDLSAPSTRTWEDSLNGPGTGDGTIIVNNSMATRSGKWRVIGDPGEYIRTEDLTDHAGGYAPAIIVNEPFLHHNCLLSEGRGRVTWIPHILMDGNYEVYVWLTDQVDTTLEIHIADSTDPNGERVITKPGPVETTNIGEYRINFAKGLLDRVNVEGPVTTPGWYRLSGLRAKEKTIGNLIYKYYTFEKYDSYSLRDPYIRKESNGYVELRAGTSNVYADAVMFYKIPD
ncbi:MAG: hypothetical protein ACC630_00865 [Nitrospinota bacterium]